MANYMEYTKKHYRKHYRIIINRNSLLTYSKSSLRKRIVMAYQTRKKFCKMIIPAIKKTKIPQYKIQRSVKARVDH